MFRGLWLDIGSGAGMPDRCFDGRPGTKAEVDEDNFR